MNGHLADSETQHPDQLSASESQPPRAQLSLRPITMAMTLIFGILIGVGGLFAYQEYVKQPPITTFDECVKANGSQQLLLYPGVCTTRDGKRFTQPLTEEERARLVPPNQEVPEASGSPTQQSPTSSTTRSKKITILDTSTWTKHQCFNIAFQLPDAMYTYTCQDYDDGRKDIIITNIQDQLMHITIQVRSYDGGSRRQYWIRALQASPEEVETYLHFQESTFGTVQGLDVFASGGWWQGGYVSPILIANGTTIVQIFGGRDFDERTGKITRWDMTDTIASTIVFL